ncbi:hypothetical protein [Halorubrum halodurans]|uniref:Uncharacterized protein n=1 Tax=Halorubrum halodurans TaxID=1383851 RepID=A0A256ICS1_9EURY|nr:hypothetical protein [Halorubrum halodurans]OYR54330.1 hypothetical protein DJ70_14190 [Halorubrum halodurans]
MRSPTRPYRALRAGVGTVVIATVLALWVRGQIVGDPLGTLWDVVVLALLLASGYAVYGRRTMTTAVEDAQELSEGGSSDTDEEESG